MIWYHWWAIWCQSNSHPTVGNLSLTFRASSLSLTCKIFLWFSYTVTLKEYQWTLSISGLISFWSSKKLSANFIKTLLFFILSFWNSFQMDIKVSELSVYVPQLSFYTFCLFICAMFLGVFSLHASQFTNTIFLCIQSAPYPSVGDFCLTFDYHIFQFKFSNRIFKTTCFHCIDVLHSFNSDGVNVGIFKHFPECSVNYFLGVSSLLLLFHRLCLLYIFGNSWL